MGIKPVSRRRLASAIIASAIVLAAVTLVTPLLGPSPLHYGRAWQGLSPDREILMDIRLPRVLLSSLTGGALAVSGVLLQALLRDALATPYTIGTSAGASLGAVVAICLGLQWAFPIPAIWVASLAGAGGTLLIVMGIASEGRHLSSFTLLLAGVTLNSICLALILFLQSLSTFSQSLSITRWLMGSIEAIDYRTLAILALVLLPLCLYSMLLSRQWNLIAVGEEWAAAKGVATGRLLLTGYLISSALVGTVTAVSGPIGFVGLLIPHALRLRAGADHRILLPCSFLLGAAFLSICDTVARTVLAPTEIPVGVVTALCGGPFFLWLLRSRRRALWL